MTVSTILKKYTILKRGGSYMEESMKIPYKSAIRESISTPVNP
jgi:hypothetical protein